MEISLSSLAAQIINFIIMFFIFAKFAARPIAREIENRRILIEKIKKADELYKQKIQEAEEKAQNIISEGMRKKESIISEGESLALKKQIEIIEEAQEKAKKINIESKNIIENMKSSLESNFIESVKKTSKLVVKKLLQKDIDLQKEYLDEIVKNSL